MHEENVQGFQHKAGRHTAAGLCVRGRQNGIKGACFIHLGRNEKETRYFCAQKLKGTEYLVKINGSEKPKILVFRWSGGVGYYMYPAKRSGELKSLSTHCGQRDPDWDGYPLFQKFHKNLNTPIKKECKGFGSFGFDNKLYKGEMKECLKIYYITNPEKRFYQKLSIRKRNRK